ncbi:histamine H3 receptor-like [Diadema antillarum]|uniref:histamine H3 receptor-like n=1 Tax=Diadema antillarum TaxID=105358 RepID=UPI003A89A4BC
MALTTEDIWYTSDSLAEVTEDNQTSIAILFTYVALIAVIISGNCMVIFSYAQDKDIKKRTSNFIIMNLAIADLLVGMVSLTMNASWIASGRWLFGEIVCKLYSVVDYVAVNMSIAMIAFISLDRYYAVTKHFKYQSIMSLHRVKIAITTTWVAITAYWLLIAFGWTYIVNESKMIDYSVECYTEYHLNPVASVAFESINCIVPASGIAVLNILIFLNIKKQWNQFRRVKINQGASTSKELLNERIKSAVEGELSSNLSADSSQQHKGGKGTSPLGISPVSLTVCVRDDQNLPEDVRRQLSADRFKRSLKIATKLAIYVGIFAACWLPYGLMAIVGSFCYVDCVPKLGWNIAENVQWANSAINPILYALTNKRFRQKAAKLLGCSSKTSM